MRLGMVMEMVMEMVIEENPASQADIHPTHFQPLPPYYFILTVHNLAHNTSHP